MGFGHCVLLTISHPPGKWKVSSILKKKNNPPLVLWRGKQRKILLTAKNSFGEKKKNNHNKNPGHSALLTSEIHRQGFTLKQKKWGVLPVLCSPSIAFLEPGDLTDHHGEKPQGLLQGTWTKLPYEKERCFLFWGIVYFYLVSEKCLEGT